jgi:hypothetical protein
MNKSVKNVLRRHFRDTCHDAGREIVEHMLREAGWYKNKSYKPVIDSILEAATNPAFNPVLSGRLNGDREAAMRDALTIRTAFTMFGYPEAGEWLMRETVVLLTRRAEYEAELEMIKKAANAMPTGIFKVIGA